MWGHMCEATLTNKGIFLLAGATVTSALFFGILDLQGMESLLFSNRGVKQGQVFSSGWPLEDGIACRPHSSPISAQHRPSGRRSRHGHKNSVNGMDHKVAGAHNVGLHNLGGGGTGAQDVDREGLLPVAQ